LNFISLVPFIKKLIIHKLTFYFYFSKGRGFSLGVVRLYNKWISDGKRGRPADRLRGLLQDLSRLTGRGNREIGSGAVE
jgi:hypothetical protein